MRQYLDAVQEILDKGTRKENRTGVDTISTFNINYEADLRDGFPLLTTKKVSWKNIVIENLWFLSGERHIGILKKHGCKFWDPWADEGGFVPSAYGNFWRHFPVHGLTGAPTMNPGEVVPITGATFNDQTRWAIEELMRNPMSRRVVVSAWAPGNAQISKLPPCHIVHVLNVQLDETNEPILCLHLTQRSCDIALGVPYNLAGYAFLLELYAKIIGIRAGIFAHTLVDAHAYTCKPDGSMAEYDHIPGLREQLSREPRSLPRLKISNAIQNLDDIEPLMRNASTEEILSHFVLEGYDPHPAIKFKVAV